MLPEIDKQIKTSMIAKDADRLRALRALKAALVKVLTDNPAVTEISEDEAIKVVQKQIKLRKDSLEIYTEQNRPDLAKIEADEIKVLEEYLPQQLPIEEVTTILEQIIKETGATSVKDTGKVMGLATKQLSGKVDNKTIGEIVKKLLS